MNISVIHMDSNKIVAEFNFDDMDLNKALELAFTKTQNIDESWSPEHYRSTMVGDVMIVDKQDMYVVEMFGFKRLEEL